MYTTTAEALKLFQSTKHGFLKQISNETKQLQLDGARLLTSQEKGMPAAVKLGNYFLAEKEISIPVLIPFADAPNLYFETDYSERANVLLRLQQIVVDLVEHISHEACTITVIDPRMDSLPFMNKLRAPFVKLAYNEPAIRQALRTVIQQNTRVYADCITAGFTRLTDYNATQEYAEAYNVVVVPDVLQLQSRDVLDLLQSLIGRSKAGCYVIMAGAPVDTIDTSRYRAQLAFVEQLCGDSERCIVIKASAGDLVLPKSLSLSEVIASVPNVTDLSVLGARVAALKQLQLADQEAENFLSIPIGRQGARPFHLELGNGVEAFHALIGGRTGSGKSNLLNNMIVEIGRQYEADDIQLYLLDYKQGLEFAPFATHPNVALLLTDNKNIERGIEVLKDLRTAIDERGQLFQKFGARNIEGYREKSGKTMPRIILIVDEFQVLFSGKFRNKANEHLKDIARRGRSFGLHLVLSSQSLKDYSLDTDLKNQLGLRIALRLEANECPGFLDIDNDGPTYLEKYHAIINTKSGKRDGNNVLKLNYLSDDALDQSISVLAANDIHQIEKVFIARTDSQKSAPQPQLESAPPSPTTSEGRSVFDSLFEDIVNKDKPTEKKTTGNKTFDDLMKNFDL